MGAFVGFIVFRALDVVKPWPSGRFERIPGGLGVMADDGMAAVYGNVVMRIAARAGPGWLVVVTALRRAAIVAVGSELLTPSKLDTNSLHITDQLNRLGLDVVAKAVVGDTREELTHMIRALLGRVDLLILCGGLGPTDDDVTREAVAAALERPLAEDEPSPRGYANDSRRADLRCRCRRSIDGRRWCPPVRVVIENTKGSAPGLWIDHDGKTVLLLPGPPRELKPMLAALVEGPLRERSSGEPLVSRVVRIAGRIESDVDQVLRPLYREWAVAVPAISATILAAPGAIELHVSARASSPELVERALDTAVQRVVSVIGADVYSTDGRKLEQVVGDLLAARGLHIAVAESCTGGLITSRLTDVPGSSRYVDQSIITYSNEAKTELLGVPTELLNAHGAVSEPVALAMADGIRVRADADVGVGVTGIAGPTGGTPEKPVGMVVVAVVTASDRRVPHVSFLRRARAGEVPGLSVGTRHGQTPFVLTMRLFIAVEMNPSVAEAAREVIDDLRARVTRLAPRAHVTWSAPDRIHVTVRFIGDADEAKAQAIRSALGPTIDAPVFDVTVEGIGDK